MAGESTSNDGTDTFLSLFMIVDKDCALCLKVLSNRVNIVFIISPRVIVHVAGPELVASDPLYKPGKVGDSYRNLYVEDESGLILILRSTGGAILSLMKAQAPPKNLGCLPAVISSAAPQPSFWQWAMAESPPRRFKSI